MRLKSTNGWLALGNGKGCQNQKLYMWYGHVFFQRVESRQEASCYVPRSSQVVNKGDVGKCHGYYQFIMKAEGMKNCGIRIMHSQQTLSPVSYTRGFAIENLQLDLEHLITMNSLSSNMFSSPVQFFINPRCSPFSPVIEQGLSSICNFPC